MYKPTHEEVVVAIVERQLEREAEQVVAGHCTCCQCAYERAHDQNPAAMVAAGNNITF